jgi:hypothetical protein
MTNDSPAAARQRRRRRPDPGAPKHLVVPAGATITGQTYRNTTVEVHGTFERNTIVGSPLGSIMIVVAGPGAKVRYNNLSKGRGRGISITAQATGAVVEGNHLHDWVGPDPGNRDVVCEGIQLCQSHGDTDVRLQAQVRGNLITGPWPEKEVISIKSSFNTVQNNTLAHCADSYISHRHGHDNVVDGNVGNIVVLGGPSVFTNNHCDKFVMMSGTIHQRDEASGGAHEYPAAEGNKLAHNSKAPSADTSRPLHPTDNADDPALVAIPAVAAKPLTTRDVGPGARR